jgi:hypothetical protein
MDFLLELWYRLEREPQGQLEVILTHLARFGLGFDTRLDIEQLSILSGHGGDGWICNGTTQSGPGFLTEGRYHQEQRWPYETNNGASEIASAIHSIHPKHSIQECCAITRCSDKRLASFAGP